MPPSPAAVDAYLDAARKAGDIDLRPCSLVSPAFQPIPPHKVGIAHLIGRSRFLLGDPTGLGKTPQVLVAFGYVREQRPETRLLVLCGKGAQLQWADEAERFLPSLSVEVAGFARPKGRRAVRLKPSDRKQQWERFATGQTAILITTYHTLALDWRLPTGAPEKEPQWVWAFPEAWAPFLVAMDECHHLRSAKQTLLYPSAKALAARARAVWGLTATPLSNRLTDLWYVYEVLVPGLMGSLRSFEERYLNRTLKTIWIGKGKKRKVWQVLKGGRNLPELAEKLRPYTLKRPPEVLGKHMPSLMVLPRTVVMDQKQTALYFDVLGQQFPRVKVAASATAQRRQAIEQAHEEALGDVVASTPIAAKAAALGYAQMALDAPEVLGHPDVPSAKIDELVDLLDGELAAERVLVYTRYKQVAIAATKRLKKAGIAADVIHGDVTATKRRDLQTLFQANSDDLRVLVLNSAGRESLNLQAASVIVFLDLPWSWSEFIQVVGRARRFGSAHAQVRLLLLGAITATNDTTLDTTTLTQLQDKAILVKGTFGLTLAENELTNVEFDTPEDTYAVPGSIADDLFADLYAAANERSDPRSESESSLASV